MRNQIILFGLFFSLNILAQSQSNISVSCFADVHFGKSNISVGYNHQSIYPQMAPQVFYTLVLTNINFTKEYCTNISDIEVDIERVKTAIQSAKISSLNEQEQNILLHQMALSLIWNKLYKPDADIIQSQINEMEQYGSGKNKENLQLVINLCHQVFDGE